MTPLSDALTAAQRSALAALEKAYVSGSIDLEQFTADLQSFGVSDPVDTAFLLAALDTLREWGVSAPTMTERVSAENNRASKGQTDYITDLCKRLVVDPPDVMESLTKEQASEIIARLKSGTYKPSDFRVPF
jgi:hypothetical protein